MKHISLDITAGACYGAALCVLILPVNWVFGWLLAIAVHEAGHLAVLYSCRLPVLEIRLGLFGAKISTLEMTNKQEILCAAAGPISSLSLLFIAEQLPVASMIGLVQGLFNLLPIYPLDGGRIVRALLSMIRERNS